MYAIDRPFWPSGAAYSASNSLGLVGLLNFDTGNLTPIVTGLKNPRGMAFVSEQEDDEGDSPVNE